MQVLFVEIIKVNKFYGLFQVLKDVSLLILLGKVICLIGFLGLGKFMLLCCINFFEEYDLGEVCIDGKLMGYDVLGCKMLGKVFCGM